MTDKHLTVDDLRKVLKQQTGDTVIVFERVDEDGNLFDCRYCKDIRGSFRYGENAVTFVLGPFARHPMRLQEDEDEGKGIPDVNGNIPARTKP